MSPIDTSKAKRTKHPGVKRLPDGRFLVTRSWIDPKTGRRLWRREIVSGTLADAVEARAKLRPEQKGGLKSRPRFGDFAETWLERHKQKSRIQPSTLERYTVDVAQLGVDFGGWWVDAIDYEAVEEWQTRVGAEYAPSTVNGWHRTMRLILDAARRAGVVTVNAAREVTTLPERRTGGRRGRSLEADQLARFLAAVPKAKLPEDAARLVTCLALTGMRIGEVLALRWESVAGGELHVTDAVWRGQPKATKTDDPRRVTIVRPLAKALREQRAWLLREQHPGLGSGLVFPAAPQQAAAGAARRGGEVRWYRSQTSARKAILAVCKVAKVPEITPHSLRRTFEDVLREAGVDKLVRRAVAGWRSEKAQGIYATVSRRERDEAAAALVRVLGERRRG